MKESDLSLPLRKARKWAPITGLIDLLILAQLGFYIAATSVRQNAISSDGDLKQWQQAQGFQLCLSMLIIGVVLLVTHAPQMWNAWTRSMWWGFYGMHRGKKHGTMRYRAARWWWQALWGWNFAIISGLGAFGLFAPGGLLWVYSGIMIALGLFSDNGTQRYTVSSRDYLCKTNGRPRCRLHEEPGFIEEWNWRKSTEDIAIVYFEPSALKDTCKKCPMSQHWRLAYPAQIWAGIEPLKGPQSTMEITSLSDDSICACQWRAIGAAASRAGCKGWTPMIAPTGYEDGCAFAAWARTSDMNANRRMRFMLVGGDKAVIDMPPAYSADGSVSNQTVPIPVTENNSPWRIAVSLALLGYNRFASRLTMIWPDCAEEGGWGYVELTKPSIFQTRKKAIEPFPCNRGYIFWATKDMSLASKIGMVVEQERIARERDPAFSTSLTQDLLQNACEVSIREFDYSYLLILPHIKQQLTPGLHPGPTLLNTTQFLDLRIHLCNWYANGYSRPLASDEDYAVFNHRVKHLPSECHIVYQSNYTQAHLGDIIWFTSSCLYVNRRDDALDVYIGLRKTASNHGEIAAVALGPAYRPGFFWTLPYAIEYSIC